MLCKIADLYVEVPEVGGMAPRLRAYATDETVTPDIVIREEEYDPKHWPGLPAASLPYMDSGLAFYIRLLKHGGLMLHASAVELDGRAYLFSGPSGMGKSTHTRLWQQEFPTSRVFNDDKPALRQLDGVWYAYGTPWCGKDGININTRVPLAGICFLRRGTENSIRRLSPIEAAAAIISQTNNRLHTDFGMSNMTAAVEKLITQVPIYELRCLAEPSAAHLSYETMRGGKT